MKKNPLIVFTGLAVAAIAGVLGVTRDRWMGEAPQTLTSTETGGGQTTVQSSGSASGQSTATQTAESSATATATGEGTAASTQQTAASTTEQSTPSTEATSGQAGASTGQAASTATEQTAAGTATGQAATGTSTEQPATSTSQSTTTTTTTTVAATTTTEQPATSAGSSQDTGASETQVAAAEVEPTFDTVRVEKTGEAVIAGRAAAGAEVAVKLNGETIATATTNADGAFVAMPEKALPEGSGTLTVEAKGANETVAVKGDQSVVVMVPAGTEQKGALVAVMAPDQPTKVLQKPEAEEAKTPVSLDAVDYDAAGNIVFNGRATPDSAVRLYVDNAAAGDAKADADGRWSFTGAAAMPAGNHMLRIDGLDAAGKVTSRVELPFVREELAKVAEAAATTDQGTATDTSSGSQTEGTTEPPKPKDGRVVIQPGNNLWRISKVIYGTGTKFTVIFDANKELIKDPDRIYPGQIFMTPDFAGPEAIDPNRRDPMTPEELTTQGQ